MRKQNLWAFVLMAALGACDSTTTAPTIHGAIVTVVFDSHPADTMHVFVESQATIDAARAYVATKTGPRLLIGKIVRGSDLDPKYPFHFKSDSVSLADFAIELCDGAPMRSAQEVDAFFLGTTGQKDAQVTTWCPWSSRPISVEEFGR